MSEGDRDAMTGGTLKQPPRLEGLSTLILAHRGRVAHDPENAIEALERLPAGLHGVEVDARSTTDGHPVLMHDPTVDRTTNGSGAVRDLSLTDCRRLRGSGGARVPLLSEYLRACAVRPALRVFVDVKDARSRTIDTVVREINACGYASRCVVLVRSDSAAARVRSRARHLELGLLGANRSNVNDLIHIAKRYRASCIFVAHGDDRYLRNREITAPIRAAAIQVGASAINAVESITAAQEDGCRYVLTDVADELLDSPSARGGARAPMGDW